MPYLTSTMRSSILSLLGMLSEDLHAYEDCGLHGPVRLEQSKVRVPLPASALRLELGCSVSHRLNLASEIVIGANGAFERGKDYLLFDPERFFSGINGFLRLAPGETLSLGRDDAFQQALLEYPQCVDAQHLCVKLTHDQLSFQRKSLTHTTLIEPIDDQTLTARRIAWRRANIKRLSQVLEAPIELLSPEDALSLLEQAITVMECEPFRLPMRDGRPGAVLQLPDHVTPIFVGDLHACIDNLLVILTQNGFLKSLQDGSGALIILGDAVHPDAPGQEDEMETSMILMDLILRLKVLFPKQIFYLRGNHDSFSEAISKGGVPQGLVWEKALLECRGARYRDAMQRLYDVLPYIALSASFIACHAAAPTMKVSRDDLIHAREHPKLEHQLAHGRIRKPNTPGGYGNGDVKRFRKRFGLASDTPFIVGHTPLSADATYWLNACGIEHHHIVFSAATTQVGVITCADKRLIPLRYPVEPLWRVYNRLFNTKKTHGSQGKCVIPPRRYRLC